MKCHFASKLLPYLVTLLALCAAGPNAMGQSFTVLFAFNELDGSGPSAPLIMDSAGNLYGTTSGGGRNFYGTVFELVKSSGSYTETILHNFDGLDGQNVFSPVVMDSAGNLYGTASAGGSGIYGTVFKLDPYGNFTLLHNFTGGPNDGTSPFAGLLVDSSGNLYGTTTGGGTNNLGSVFKLDSHNDFSLLYSFAGLQDSQLPSAGLIQDANGNLYGTTSGGFTQTGYEAGTVFELVNTSGQSISITFTHLPVAPTGAAPMIS